MNHQTWQQAIAEKHAAQIEAHEAKHGKLGVLRIPPTEEQLEKDLQDRREQGFQFWHMKKEPSE